MHGMSALTLVPLLACLVSCQPLEQDPLSSDSADAITFESLGFESDSFDLASTKDRQLEVFEALFIGKDGYRIPGDPDPDRGS